MGFKNINEAEEYVKTKFHLPFVNFSDYNLRIIEELIAGLEDVFRIYPDLKYYLCMIGPLSDIDNQINMITNSYTIDEGETFNEINWNSKGNDDSHMAIHWSYDQLGKIDYVALALNSSLTGSIDDINNEYSKYASQGYVPKHCINFRSLVWHEMMHVLDLALDISVSQEFQALIRRVNVKNEISRYASKYSIHEIATEAFAEAMAEYHLSPKPTGAIKNIGDLAYQKYFARSSRKSAKFDLNRGYKI